MNMFGKTAQFAGKVSKLNAVLDDTDDKSDDGDVQLTRKEKKKMKKEELEEQRKQEELRLKHEEERSRRQAERASLRNAMREKYGLKENEKDKILVQQKSVGSESSEPKKGFFSKLTVVHTEPTDQNLNVDNLPTEEKKKRKKDCSIM